MTFILRLTNCSRKLDTNDTTFNKSALKIAVDR